MGRHSRTPSRAFLLLSVLSSGLLLGATAYLVAELIETTPMSTTRTTSLAFASATSSTVAVTDSSADRPPQAGTATVESSFGVPTTPSPTALSPTSPRPTSASTASTASTVSTTPPATAAPLVFDPEAELQIATSTNQLRASLAIPQLAANSSLKNYARNHAMTMAETDTFAHSDIGDLLGAWVFVGENIGRAGTATAIFQGFLGSSSHYNILVDPAFTDIGVGAVREPDGTLWICQVFAGPDLVVVTFPTSTALTIPIPLN